VNRRPGKGLLAWVVDWLCILATLILVFPVTLVLTACESSA